MVFWLVFWWYVTKFVLSSVFTKLSLGMLSELRRVKGTSCCLTISITWKNQECSLKTEQQPVYRSSLGADFSSSPNWLVNRESIKERIDGAILQIGWTLTEHLLHPGIMLGLSQSLLLWNFKPPLWVRDVISTSQMRHSMLTVVEWLAHSHKVDKQ